MRDLTITLIQTPLHWEDIEANLAAVEKRLDRLDVDTDLVVLPEMFTTGFTMNAALLAQEMSGPAVQWLTQMAGRVGCAITGSMIIQEGQRYYNRLLWAQPDGQLEYYDKRHLFRMSGEHEIYSAGARHLTIHLHGWRLRPFICYDLRFPVWLRNVANAYDAAIYIANWPRPRSMHWKRLLQARAVENQSYVVGVNRVGTDGNGQDYSGDSMVIDPKGEVRFQAGERPCVQSVSLSYSDLVEYRETFPAWRDADQFRMIRD
jgi:predicted amidohydrolase